MKTSRRRVPKTKPPTPFEREVLQVVLVELRRAMRMRGQLALTIDPFFDASGAHVFASPNTMGKTYEISKGRRG